MVERGIHMLGTNHICFQNILILLVVLFVCLSIEIRAQPKPRPYDRGISDVKTRISRSEEFRRVHDQQLQKHLQNFGEIIYGIYGQEGDPAKVLIQLKQSYEAVLDALKNGVTGQVWPAVGQLGQAILDYWSDRDQRVKGINAFQQLLLESASLKQTLTERDRYRQQIARDTLILQQLEAKQRNVLSQGPTPKTLNDRPSSPKVEFENAQVDLSALDNAILLGQWLSVGDRAFEGSQQKELFYKRFVELRQFEEIARFRSPQAEVLQAFKNTSAPSNAQDNSELCLLSKKELVADIERRRVLCAKSSECFKNWSEAIGFDEQSVEKNCKDATQFLLKLKRN